MVKTTIPLLACLALLVAGCSAQETRAFGGPWAAEFAQAYSGSSDPYVRGVLEDGVVTEQEQAEVWERFVRCMSDHGLTVTVERADGSYTTDIPPTMSKEHINEVDLGCSRDTGEIDIDPLYWWVKRNPQNLDNNQIVVDCLADKGVIPEDYGPDDFETEGLTGNYSFTKSDEGFEAFFACNADPPGVFK